MGDVYVCVCILSEAGRRNYLEVGQKIQDSLSVPNLFHVTWSREHQGIKASRLLAYATCRVCTDC